MVAATYTVTYHFSCILFDSWVVSGEECIETFGCCIECLDHFIALGSVTVSRWR